MQRRLHNESDSDFHPTAARAEANLMLVQGDFPAVCGVARHWSADSAGVNYHSEAEGGDGVFRDIIVIGASSGGLALLRKLAASLPADFPAAVFIVMHTAPDGPGFLADILAAGSKMPASFPKDGDPIKPGRIYVAPPDHHVLLDSQTIVVVRGPRENRFRPAIDPLFRSAAVNHGARVIAVILSGMLDDGASGMDAVKQCGGVAVVQNPAEAEFPDMILNACAAVKPDHAVSVDAMPALFAKLIEEPVTMSDDQMQAADRVRIEADLAALRRTGAAEVQALGTLSRLVCPECNGSLWEVKDEHILRFRCHIGHAFSAHSLAVDQANALERALSIALRTLDDTAALAGRLAGEAEKSGRAQSAVIFQRRRDEALENAEVVRKVLADQRSLRAQPEEEPLSAQPEFPAQPEQPRASEEKKSARA